MEKKMNRKERAKQQRENRRHQISLLRTIPYPDHLRWWSSETIALVTGANRGIGFEIARQLLLQGVTVILTSRGTEVGEAAADVLRKTGLKVVFHQLDVTNTSSVKTCADWIQQTYGGLNILINNAGINFNASSENSVEFAEQVIATNYIGTKNMIKALTPLMRPSAVGARIVNVSSRLGRLNGRRNRIGDVRLREPLECVDSLTEEVINRTMDAFLEQVKDGSWAMGGWPQTFTDYSISKLAVNAYTRLMAKKFSDRPEGAKIYINCCCPGWVKTAMTGWEGNNSVEEGADTAVWLALLLDQSVAGGGSEHVMTFEVGKVLDHRYWQAPEYCFSDAAGEKNANMDKISSGVAVKSNASVTYCKSFMQSLANCDTLEAAL